MTHPTARQSFVATAHGNGIRSEIETNIDFGKEFVVIPKFRILCIALLCGVTGIAQAAEFNKIKVDFVLVGDPNNPENTRPKNGDGSTGYGSVSYAYRIGKYEVTNNQYVEFLNAVASITDTHALYNPNMTSSVHGGIIRTGTAGNYSYSAKEHFGDKPVNYVSFYDGARLANWLQNGQKYGYQDSTTTEVGAYTFSGSQSVSLRDPNAKYFMPDEHEWQKAAFYEPGAVTEVSLAGEGDGWWSRTFQSDINPTAALVDATGNVINPGPTVVNFQTAANWNGSTIGNVVTVGGAGSKSYYGAYDMAGNVFEWVYSDPSKPDPNGWGPYAVLGGSFRNIGHYGITDRNLLHHDNHNKGNQYAGIRLAAAVPEPSGLTFMAITTLFAFSKRRRNRKPVFAQV